MKVLEVRFHPHTKKGGPPVAIARVLCEQEKAIVEPIEVTSRRLQPFDTDALMRKLAFLIESAKPRLYEGLTTLRSDFWSFSEVAGPAAPRGDAG
ncbi:MAG TPA: hypothetical protein VIF57_13575 [Polyangia bacterium]|jgi:hypothetical protein